MEDENNKPPENAAETPPVNTTEPVQQSANITVPPVDTPRKKHRPRRTVVVVSVAILLVAAGASWFALQRANKPAPSQQDTAKLIEQAKKANTQAAPKAASFAVQKLANGDSVVGKETWFKTPIKLSLSDYSILKTQDPDWMYVQQVGSMSDGTKIVLFSEAQDGGEVGALLLASGTSLKLVESASPDFFYQGKPVDDLAPGVTIDSQTTFPELNLPQTLQINGKNFTNTKSDKLGIHITLPNAAKYGDTDYGPVYKDVHITSDHGTYQTVGYYVQTYDFHWVFYQPEPHLTSINKDTITFSDGTKNDDAYTETFRGCGLGAYEDFLTDNTTNVTAAGTVATGQQLYALADLANTELGSDTLKNHNEQFSDSPLTQDAYLKLRPILLYKNTLGSYTALFNEKVISGGGCGKPVIYLYPTKTTNVSVKIDATIKKSVPAYNGGWNVVAQPNGLLTTGGKAYDSLYWEGFGLTYPTVQDGFVVRQQDVAATIDSNLQQLGLNAKERADFAAYWLPRLPHTPYVRLTWFGTAQMNRLAPLHISPRPDTLIRVFLDYEGLSSPVTLPTEHLTALPRNGFTVVEWGGLQNALQ
ncbi:MAG TPA: hypothetical protein VFI84_00020 [Candidatus Saccharimonadales bacterium]|nr:hypothetical protein [Candidatus Saccharimonadales bacterium]